MKICLPLFSHTDIKLSETDCQGFALTQARHHAAKSLERRFQTLGDLAGDLVRRRQAVGIVNHSPNGRGKSECWIAGRAGRRREHATNSSKPAKESTPPV